MGKNPTNMTSAKLARKFSFSKLRLYSAYFTGREYPFCPEWDRQLNTLLDRVDHTGWDTVGGLDSVEGSGVLMKDGIGVYYRGGSFSTSGEVLMINEIRVPTADRKQPSRRTQWRFFKSLELHLACHNTKRVSGTAVAIDSILGKGLGMTVEDKGRYSIVKFGPTSYYLDSTKLVTMGLTEEQLTVDLIREWADFVVEKDNLRKHNVSVEDIIHAYYSPKGE